MAVIFQPIKSRQLTKMCRFPYLFHNNAVLTSGTLDNRYFVCNHYKLPMLCLQLKAIMFLFNIKYLAVLLPNYCPT